MYVDGERRPDIATSKEEFECAAEIDEEGLSSKDKFTINKLTPSQACIKA